MLFVKIYNAAMSGEVINTFISNPSDFIPSIKALAAANVSHNDVKPSNFLTDWPQGTTPKISNLKIYLTDFGMVDRAGGTPIYCSPEGLTGAIPGLSDMYSLGRVFTFLVCENRDLFIWQIFFPLKNEVDAIKIRSIIESFPIMKLIKKMTHIDRNQRISITEVDRVLSSTDLDLELVTVEAMVNKGLEQIIVEDINYIISNLPKEQISIMVKER